MKLYILMEQDAILFVTDKAEIAEQWRAIDSWNSVVELDLNQANAEARKYPALIALLANHAL